MKDIKIKVCGMRDPENIDQLIKLRVDFMGLIFYPGSSRFAGDSETDFSQFQRIIKTGVFVNSDLEDIVQAIKKYGLEAVQLHGDETPEFASQVRKQGVKVIKAFPVWDEGDLEKAEDYRKSVDFYLFDTKGEKPGGNGIVFDWEILNDKTFSKPFFLAGGLNQSNIQGISKIKNPAFYAVDLNSGVEIKPALKDLKEIKTIKNKIAQICQSTQ
ncbi:phosphoribosylanthranilate isomerase [Mangrovivirga sp. M17]|uniref:N-(5'-phosphoribosyl)anthranilate isomerase n=1 Tax=Mangrovivirga halotolerans TaxID=2993936 RepID=A0ABT3RVD3_9BACT|nr:phosphoribosylanthranilate isomerase [Mangrovivirga halotolerans]MCX2745727.1 phosphoribosylanthranilate isomerase [Mangrovivirga halotolerans]